MAGLRIVVTGAAGFVAASAVERLVSQGHEVLAWIRPETDARRLAGLQSPAGLQVFRLDLRGLLDPAGREEALEIIKGFRPDAVLHAAWRGMRAASRDDPAQVENVVLAIEVLRVCAEAGARRWVGVGSQAEYGPQQKAIREDTTPQPVALYGAAKLACGHLSVALARRLGLRAAWARLFSVYGPGESSGALVPDLALALAEGRSFPLGTGEQHWDYLYVSDAAEALEALLISDKAEGFFNVGSGQAVPLHRVVTSIRDLIAPGATLALGALEPKPGQVNHLEADIQRIYEVTGWRPRVSLGEGLARTFAGLVGDKRPGFATTS